MKQPQRATPALLPLILIVFCLLASCDTAPAPTPHKKGSPVPVSKLTQYVNPFIGTAPQGTHFGFAGNAGDTFPGATYPMGMVQWSPDTTSHIPGGYYYPDSVINGFSLTHFSGRGCNVYQDIPFIPYVGQVSVSPAVTLEPYASSFRHDSEQAQPGYYRVHLDGPNVTAELSVTAHTGMAQFTYPASKQATMLINAGGSINGTQKSSVTINANDQSITGSATSTVGCGANHYTIYFAASFDQHFSAFGTWKDATIQAGATNTSGDKTGAFVSFDASANHILHIQVGISFVSIENAQANLAAEQAHFNFNQVRNSTDAAWEARLQTIQVQGGSNDEKSVFYTALYHAFIHPNIFSDVNGQYLGFDNQVHSVAAGHQQYENIPGWDQYRSLSRLQAILAPQESSDIAQSLVNDAQQGDGHLPRWEQANVDSHGMSGDGGTLITAEIYAFGDRDFDTAGALTAMIQGQSKVREGLDDYTKLGYVANETLGYSVAATQEYSNADFALAQFAQSLGKSNESKTFLTRSGNWEHLFNTDMGYIEPRNRNGNWATGFHPTSQHGFQEGNSAQYTWMEPFDLHDLFSKMGGNAAVVRRLDDFFTKLNEGPDSAYAFMGNEPSVEIPWEYDFAGAPSHTQEVIRRIQLSLFQNTPAGLPGNDDGGAMSSWYVFSAIGLYPEITGVGGFVIGSPLFSSITIKLAGGHTLQIDASGAGDGSPYVQSLSVNKQPSSKLWLPWESVQNGATLSFALTQQATTWATGANDMPPSYAPTS